MSRYLNAQYQRLEQYTPGEQPQDMVYTKLNTNESPFPPAPAVIEAVQTQELSRLQLYCDPECRLLREKIAERYGVKKENIYVSNGSDDILNFAFMAFCGEKREAVFPDISYGFYQVFADLHGIMATRVPLRDDFSLDYCDYCGRNQLIVIANPNAPTGMTIPVSEIEAIVKTNPNTVVVIDEAYVDFGGESCYPLTAQYDNLLVVQTFSKSRSMAGARLGFAIGCEALISDLERLRYSTNPYNVNRMTQMAGVVTMEQDEYYMDNCRTIIHVREQTTKKLQELGFLVLPSKANFIFATHPQIDGGRLYEKLKARGILVRHFNAPRIFQYNRITIGTAEQMAVLLEQIQAILKEEGL